MRRYLKEIEREYDLESVPARGGGPLLVEGALRRDAAQGRAAPHAGVRAARRAPPVRADARLRAVRRDRSGGGQAARASRSAPAAVPMRGSPTRGSRIAFCTCRTRPRTTRRRPKSWTICSRPSPICARLRLSYKSAFKADEERITIHPYALVLHRDSVYCVGSTSDKAGGAHVRARSHARHRVRHDRALRFAGRFSDRPVLSGRVRDLERSEAAQGRDRLRRQGRRVRAHAQGARVAEAGRDRRAAACA